MLQPESRLSIDRYLDICRENAATWAKKSPKPKKQGETLVRDACEELLRMMGCFVWVNRTGAYETKKGAWIPYGYPGSPDLLFVSPSGRFGGCECKSTTKQSPKQIDFQHSVEKRGGLYILAYSADDVEKRRGEIVA